MTNEKRMMLIVDDEAMKHKPQTRKRNQRTSAMT